MPEQKRIKLSCLHPLHQSTSGSESLMTVNSSNTGLSKGFANIGLRFLRVSSLTFVIALDLKDNKLNTMIFRYMYFNFNLLVFFFPE